MRKGVSAVAFLLYALVFAHVAGCLASDEPVVETAAATSALDFAEVFYDGDPQTTVCNGFGVQMHCCPLGFVMIGAQVDRNVFKCARLNSGGGGTRFLDQGTQRNGMHACPFGSLMVGLHADRNLLICQWLQEPFSPLPSAPVPSSRVLNEYVDGPPTPFTIDGFPMHVCRPGYAMAGIHVGKNLFTCDF